MYKTPTLSVRSKAMLEALLKSPAGQEAIDAVESKTLIERRDLIAQLRKLEASHPAESARLEKAGAAARLALDKAQAAFHEAKAAYDAAALQAHGAELHHGIARRDITDRLLETADARIAAFITQLGNIRDAALPMRLSYWDGGAVETYEGKRRVLANNVQAITAAREALQDAIEAMHTLTLTATTYEEVSRALADTCDTLARPLAEVDLNPPSLNADREPRAPLPWSGRTTWETTATA